MSYDDEIVEQRMHAIKSPTLILFGEYDKVVPPRNAELMAQKIAGAHVKIIPGTGHIFPLEDPAATVREITGFLNN